MTYIVTESCIKCKYTDCVEVCPADCFYEGPNFLVIHPEECIDCALCVNECPVEAIYHEDDLPDDQQVFYKINELLAEATTFGVITEKKDPPPHADEHATIVDKINALQLTDAQGNESVLQTNQLSDIPKDQGLFKEVQATIAEALQKRQAD